jgi:hypothetical protein
MAGRVRSNDGDKKWSPRQVQPFSERCRFAACRAGCCLSLALQQQAFRRPQSRYSILFRMMHSFDARRFRLALKHVSRKWPRFRDKDMLEIKDLKRAERI